MTNPHQTQDTVVESSTSSPNLSAPRDTTADARATITAATKQLVQALRTATIPDQAGAGGTLMGVEQIADAFAAAIVGALSTMQRNSSGVSQAQPK